VSSHFAIAYERVKTQTKRTLEEKKRKRKGSVSSQVAVAHEGANTQTKRRILTYAEVC
jgi:hypothetical protein